MLNLKKGLALVLAAATAFTFAPVANLGAPVQAEAAEAAGKQLIDSADTSKGYNNLKAVATVKAGTYRLVANSADAWKALTVTGWTQDGTTAQSTINDYDTDQTAFKPSIAETTPKTGLNGTYTFTLRKVGETGDTSDKTAQDIVTWTVELKNSVVDGLTAGSVNTCNTWTYVVPTVAPVSKSDTFGENPYSEIEYGSKYKVPFTAPVYSYDPITEANAKLDFDYSGNSVVLTASQTAGSKLTSASLEAVSTGKTEVTAKWIATKDIKKGSDVVFKANSTISTVKFTVNVVNSTGDIEISYKNASNTTTKLTAANKDTVPAGTPNANIQLDTLINKTAKITVSSATAPTFVSSDPGKVTVASDGTLTAVAYGSTSIVVYIGNAKFTIPVSVADVATDALSLKVNGEDVNNNDKPINLDLSTSTAANAVKSAKLDVVSAGSLPYSIYLATDNGSTSAVAGSANDIVSVASDGTITAGAKAGTAYVYVGSKTQGKVAGKNEWVKVVVNATPAAQVSVDDVTLDLTNNKTADINVVTNVDKPVIDYFVETTKNADGTTSEDTGIVKRLGKTLTAQKYGVATLRVVVHATTTTRQTEAKAKIYVLQDAAKKASDLKVASSALTVAVGKTASAGASTTASGAAITYSSDNEKVATVAADGTITAVAPGTAVITVKAAETKTVNAGFATVTVTVPQNPAKVTGLKVANKKGAKVSVSWTSQGGSISYRVYKKVGNGKWVAKNVTSNKATLSVKKGAKVQVKVKAFVKDSTGKTTWGPKATKVTKTTDKK